MGEVRVYSDPHRVDGGLAAPEPGFSVVTVTGGWPEDLLRLAEGLRTHCSRVPYEVVVVINDSREVEEVVEQTPGDAVGIAFRQRVGYGAATNAGMSVAAREIVVVADTSVYPTGDFLGPLGEVLRDRSVGVAGKWGLVTNDLRSFEEKTSSEVDAMQGYCLAFSKDAVGQDLMFDPKFKYYRNADIDFSFRWRNRGYRIMAVDLPLERGVHREWEETPPDLREKKSRDNFARFLRSWGNRTDLLIGPSD